MKAFLSNHRQSPRKTRLVVDMIRGKSVAAAREALHFLPKKSAEDVLKLLNSAAANAKQQGMNLEDLVVKTVSVDKAMVIRRFTPKARGRAAGIRRTRSHVALELGLAAGAKPKAAKKASKKTARKSAKQDAPASHN